MSTGTMTNNGFTYVFLTLLTTSFVINSCEAFPWFWDSDDDTQSDEPSTVSNSWKVGDWNACSKSCGANGTQSRTVVCQATSADGVVTLKEDSDCTGPKPDVVRPCSADQPCPEWQPTPWSDCSRQCDEGLQTREVVCIVQLSNKRKHPLPEAQCDISTKPATSQACNNGPCSAYEWISSDWSGCHHPTCELGAVETRVVMCVNMNGDVAETERCDKFQKPATTRSCVVQNTCKAKPQWHATQWAPCSARCGSGTQQRKVFCAVAEGTDHLRRRPSEECDPATRMTDIQDCQGHNCSAVWFTGLYGKCSKDCDGGERKRAVMCVAMASSRQVADSECDATSRPADVDHCNQQSCNAAALPGPPLRAVVKKATPTSVLLDIEAPLDNGGSRLIGYDVFHEGQHYAFTLDDPFFVGNLRPGYSYEFTIRARSEVGLGQAFTLAYKMPETGAASLDCHESEFGCCPDGVTPADGPHQHGCLHRDRVPEGIECAESQYGCCSDGTTAATGPNGKGCEDDQDGSSGDADSTARCSGLDCQQSATCSDAMYGCCPDGTTSATGPDFEGCSDVHSIPCEELAYGCCPDGSTPAIDSDGSNCPSEDEGQDCSRSTYGCCSDGVTFALGPDFEGCASPKTVPCEDLVYGCCPDGTTPAVDHDGTNCPQEVFEEPVRAVFVPTLAAVTVLSDCYSSEFGCCPDGQTSAQGPGGSGCGSDCASSMYGCCLDGVSAASGMNFEGCSEQMASGEQAACADSTYGCCPDGTTSALGPHESGCPSKIRQGAYCKTPSEASVCGEYEVKWFFDSAVGICTRAWYSGCDIDAHHFDNEEDCQAYCVSPSGLDKCYLPASVGRCRASVTRYFYNATSRRCQTFVYGGCDGNANNFNDVEECQQSCEQPLSPDVCSQPVTTGPCRGSYERFYFDSETKSCMTFSYGGCRGNDNRFPTIEACENRCKRSQSAHDVCDLPKETGRCRAAMSMWYYNSQIGECQQFTYGGCDGNGNRFATRLECENTCSRGGVAKERKDTCALPQDSGPCRGYFERWYFDSKDRTCRQFVYGGCHGNDNRFDTEAACRSACNALPPTDVCSLPSDQGPCYDYVLRHFYDQTTNRCEYFYYGGCEGNDNNFGSAEECEKHCTEPEAEHAVSHDTCSLSMDVGPCSRSLQRWYYSVTEQRCREFTYGGCQGNGNRFTTEEECERQCGGRLDSEIGRRTSQPDDTHVRHSATDAVCLLERDSGTCDDPRALWYFDSSSQVCRRFLYSGCGGNGNRFETEEECSARCLGNRNDEDNDSVRPESLISAPGIHASDRTDEGHCVDFRGYVVAHGERYNPHQDPCLVCTCHHGRDEHCMISHCQPPDCDWVPIEGQCCKFHCRNSSSTTSSSTDDEPGEIVDEPCFADICEHQCPYGFVQSSDGCKSCRCHQPCKKLECSHSFECQLQNVYCDTALCADGTTACHQPVTEIGEIKSGLCPRSDILHQPSSQCNDDCYSDQDCAGTYRCCETSCGGRTCMPTVGSISSTDDLVEVLDHVQASIPAVVDETVSMPCRNGKTAGATIRWYHDRMLLPDDPAEEDGRLSVQPDGTLVLSGVSEDDNSVTYTCLLIVDNDLSSAVAHSHAIDIQDPPRFTDDQETHRSLAPAIGATVQLDCPVDGNPLPVITWHKDGHVIYEGRNHIFQKGETILIIRQVQQSDGGNYECEAYNGIGGSLVRAFTIEPLIDSSYHRPLEQSSGSGLRFTDDQSEYRTLSPSLGSTVRLDCPVQDIDTALVTWLKNDFPVEEDNNVVVERDGLALVIYRLQFSDGGNYECRVQNRAGDSLHRIFVVEPLIEESVYDPLGHGTPSSSTARMTFTDDQSSHQSLGPALGSTVQLECPVAVTPPPRISWMKDGVVIGSDPNHVLQNGGMVFLIRNLRDSDGGNYECEVTNSVGETLRRTFTVEPLIEQDVYKPLYPQPPAAATAGSSNRRRLEARILAEKHEVSVGDTVRLECRTTHGDDDVEVTWSLNDQPLSSSAAAVENHLKFEGFHLVIEKVVKADEGTYVCRAQSSADDVAVNSDPFKLDVIAVAVPSDCVDKPWYANCALIVEAQMCRHPYFSVFCCNSCYAAGLLP